MPTDSEEKEAAVSTAQIVISGVPTELVREIDEMAEREDRTRAAFVRRVLMEAIARRRSQKKAA